MAFDDPTDHIARKIIERGRFYEEDLLEDARNRMRQGTVVDVGAHVGNHTLWFAGVCGAPVVAFEPNPKSYTQLLENIRTNGLDVHAHPFAVGARETFGTLEELRPGNSGMTRVVLDPSGYIPVVTLDQYALEDVAVLKIDAEDSELDVLRGAVQLLRREKPLLYFEARHEKQRFAIEAFLDEITVGGWPLGYRLLAGPFGWTPTWCYA